MAAASDLQIERAEADESCMVLEGIVSVFSDYCQAVEALAVTQKKLARMLKNAATLKTTNELAGSSLNASATFFEALAEIDARFVKAASKECEMATTDLEKWLKKLSKEDGDHVDKLNYSNVKIKEDGQTFERKAKGNDSAIPTENTRNANLTCTTGPEMPQKKRNYGQYISRKHSLAIYAVASSISRMADAEWHRARDSVRRSASIIGRIGEYCAYIEGGWTGKFSDSVDAEDKNQISSSARVCELEPDRNFRVGEMGIRACSSAQQAPKRTGSSTQCSAVQTSAPALGTSPLLIPSASLAASQPQDANQPHSVSLATKPLPQPTHLKVPRTPAIGKPSQSSSGSVRSIESLSSFPTPPMHFPLPTMAQLPRLLKSASNLSHAHSEGSSSTGITSKSSMDFASSSGALPGDKSEEFPIAQVRNPDLMGPLSVVGQELEVTGSTSASEVGIYILSGQDGEGKSTSGSNGIFASMRDKWDRGDSSLPTKPLARDNSQLTNKVSNLINRYAPPSTASQSSASSRPSDFLAEERTRKVSFVTQDGSKDEATSYFRGRTAQAGTSAASEMPPPPSRTATEPRQRPGWCPDDVEGLDVAEGWQVLSAHELIQPEFVRKHALGRPGSSTSPVLEPLPRWPHSQHSHSMSNLTMSHTNMNVDVSHKLSAVEPTPPSPRFASSRARHLSQGAIPSVFSSSSTSLPSQQGLPPHSDHSPFCRCSACSAMQYLSPTHAEATSSTSNTQMQAGMQTQMRTNVQSMQSRSQTQAQAQMPVMDRHVQKDKGKEKHKSNKPRSWIRHLSVPVVSHAFLSSISSSSSSIGSGSTYAYGAGAGISSASLQNQGQLPLSLHMEGLRQDSTGGISFVRPRKLSPGKR